MSRKRERVRYHPEVADAAGGGADAPGTAGAAPQAAVVTGRGALSNRSGRYEAWSREIVDDGWGSLDARLDEIGSTATTLQPDASRRVIARNDSPDVPFDRSINPYRGCEHGCVYCYARPTHAWLGLSPGRDFETKLFYKRDAAALLRRELGARGYRPAPIALGANTDPYQPVERRLRITRSILELLRECAHPAMVITKSVLIERDADLLAALAADSLVNVSVSVSTLDDELSRRMEPRAAGPRQRLAAAERLSRRGIPVAVLVAPVVPGLNDHEIEDVLRAARDAGAGSAGYVLLRLPLEVAGLFHEWLDAQYPERAARVRSLIRQTAGGRDYRSGFGTRMRGTGPYAELISRRFGQCRRRLGFTDPPALETGRFRPPRERTDEPPRTDPALPAAAGPAPEGAAGRKPAGRRGGPPPPSQLGLPLWSPAPAPAAASRAPSLSAGSGERQAGRSRRPGRA